MTNALPEHLKEWEDTYSNLDHEPLGPEAEAAVRAGTHYIAHPGEEHWGAIWFDNGEFVEEVMQYQVSKPLIRGVSLQEVFKSVNAKYGEA